MQLMTSWGLGINLNNHTFGIGVIKFEKLSVQKYKRAGSVFHPQNADSKKIRENKYVLKGWKLNQARSFSS